MRRAALAVTLICCILVPAFAQPDYTPDPRNLAAREWFQDAKFGMFIHWGVYSVLGDGEWVMNNKKIPVSEYEKLPGQFNPTEFNADEWVAIAKDAGMKYITITSKHHDGFAMWDTKQGDYDIVDRTPYKRDVLKMLAEACRKQDIKLFFYHSQLDWHHPDYYPRGRTGQHTGRPDSGEWYRYLDYMDAQLAELLTGYGPIGGIWFDGWWDKPDADWRLDKTYGLIHKLQPACLTGSNHHKAPKPGEDFQMFEKDLPGANTAGFNKDAAVGELPLETCDTMNRSWGYNKADKDYKSTRTLLHYLVRAAGHNANLLLNVGPMPSGRIQPEFVKNLKEMGEWMRTNGQTIYGTRGGPLKPRPWGAITSKGKTLYVHILEWQDSMLALPLTEKITKASRFGSGETVEVTHVPGGIVLSIPGQPDAIDTIVELQLAD